MQEVDCKRGEPEPRRDCLYHSRDSVKASANPNHCELPWSRDGLWQTSTQWDSIHIRKVFGDSGIDGEREFFARSVRCSLRSGRVCTSSQLHAREGLTQTNGHRHGMVRKER